MMNFPLNEKSLIVDMGCLVGTLTKILHSISNTIGLDIDKKAIVWAKKNAKHLDFICADRCYLPLKNNSVDVAFCASVLEYIEKLEIAVREINRVLKNNGKLIAGYPIETRFLKAFIEIFDPKQTKTWDPLKVMKYEEYRKDPHTHKQRFPALRDALHKHFLLIEKNKIPSKHFPDFLSIYEYVKMIKK
jgi:SAM-dependent methyltransferase